MIHSSIARKRIKTLAGAQATQGDFLTVTLSTSRLDDWRQFAPTFLNSEFNRVVKERSMSKEERRYLQEDLDYILDTVRYDVTPGTQGLAVFVDIGGDMREKMELPMRLINNLVVEPSPHIRPVVHALSLLEPFVVARVSRDESSVFLVDDWQVAQEDDFAGPWLRSSDKDSGEVSVRGYYAAARHESLVEQHFKDVGASLGDLLESSGARRVVLCALREIANDFRRNLPATVASRIVAEIPFDPAASTAQMLISARPAAEEARNTEIEERARWVAESLGAGGRGVSGFDDVLGALRRHQIQTLLVDREYREPGWRCLECDWVGLAQVETCPVGGGQTVPVVDAVAELIRLAVLQNSEIEVGENIPTLAALGGVAGVLRYS